MTLAITNWEELYETNDKGKAWKAGQAHRVGEFPYVRLRVNGAAHSAGYRDFLAAAGDMAPAAFGVFAKLLELAADHKGGERGLITTRHGDPADIEAIAGMMGFPVGAVARGVAILANPLVGWVHWTCDDSPSEGEKSGEKRSEAEKGGARRKKAEESGKRRSDAEKSGRLYNQSIRSDQEQGKTTPPGGGGGALPDPLETYPTLQSIYPGLLTAIKEAHPHANTPEPGTKADHNARKALANLIRLDGFKEGDVREALRWVFKADDEGAEFWRLQIHAIPPLRQDKNGSGIKKIGRVIEAWQRATKNGAAKPLSDSDKRMLETIRKQKAGADA